MADLSNLTSQQYQIATTVDRPLFVEAGAGSGKTFTLMQRVVWALTQGSGAGGEAFLSSLDQALIITFTEKAAREIKERVRAGLRAAGLGQEALRVDNAWISTIHGMCSRILHTHALELGLDPSFVVLGEHRTSEMREQAVERVLDEALRRPAYRALLSEYPARSMGFSSRDASITSMVFDLLNAAASAPNGFDSLQTPGVPADLPSELHSLLGSYQLLASQNNNNEDELLAVSEAASALEDFLFEKPVSSHGPEELSDMLKALYRPNGRFWRAKAVSGCAKEVQSERARLLAEIEFARVRPFLDQLLELAHMALAAYDEAKQEASGLDNDDLLRFALAALRRPSIADEYCHRFKLVMVDEFQDTSTQQVEMIKLLSGEGACHLTTVGDAQQSIYRFRGADVGVFRTRRKEVQSSTPELIMPMDRNFRSHDDILRAVERVCNHPDMIQNFMDLSANPSRPDGLAGVDLPRLHFEVVTPVTRRINNANLCPSAEMQSAVSAALIADRFAAFAREGVPAGDMAVLLRSMSRAGLYIDALRARGLDCVVTGGSTFARAPEVTQVAALLRVLANPHCTEDGLFPVLCGEMFELDADDLVALRTTTQEQTGEAVSQGIELGVFSFNPHAGLEWSSRLELARDVLLRAFDRLGSMPVSEVLLGAVRESGWIARLEAEGVSGKARAANVLAAVRHVGELCDEMALGPARASVEFDHWLEVAKEGPASLVGGQLSAVRLMTVHASKGLEFPVVAVAECLDDPRTTNTGLLALAEGPVTKLVLRPKKLECLNDIIPDEGGEARTLFEVNAELTELNTQQEREELARLLYVGLTRAREALVFSCAVKKGKKPGKNGSLYSPRMAEAVIEGYLGDMPEPGQIEFDYGGSAKGIARCVRLSYSDELELVGESGAALACFEGTLDQSPVSLCLGPAERAEEERRFVFFEPDGKAKCEPHGWSPREGVYSYSSARAIIDAEREGKRPAPVWHSAPQGADEGDEEPFDPDRATNLGSAFHLCCQRMVEEGLNARQRLSDDAVASISKACGLRPQQRERLYRALELWSGSQLRAEALSHALVRAEVPFFCHEPCSFGEYVTGAIDLLAADEHASGKALVVDYKTGERNATLAEFTENHAMQARFYARVLLDCGYENVTCVFVAVEREENGEPMEARFEFTGEGKPEL